MLVKLKPINSFFFGGDITFGEGKEVSYLAKSTLFPQQTAILGMVRKTLLRQNGLLTRKIKMESVDDKKKGGELVGFEKFKFQKEEQNFGVIKKISPLFLMSDNKRYIKKFANGWEIKKDKIGYFLQKDGKDYNGKEDLFSDFVSIDDNVSLKVRDIFEEIEQIGIKKDAQKEGYFKKFSYKLKDGFAFGFYIELEENKEYRFYDDIVELGAERSLFEMKLQECDEWLEVYHEHLLLLSDTFIDANLKELTSFAVSKDINFRFIEKNGKLKEKNEKKSKEEEKKIFKKSNIYRFYERGTIFIDYKVKLKEEIQEYKNLQKIGLNITSKEKK